MIQNSTYKWLSLFPYNNKLYNVQDVFWSIFMFVWETLYCIPYMYSKTGYYIIRIRIIQYLGELYYIFSQVQSDKDMVKDTNEIY